MAATAASVLACPFCGCKPSVRKGLKRTADGYHGEKAGEWFWKPAIGCDKCGFERHGDDLDELIAWWNSRKQPKSKGTI